MFKDSPEAGTLNVEPGTHLTEDNMKPISLFLPPKVPEKKTRKKPRPRNSAGSHADSAAQQRTNAQRQFLHDIANQLTIVALAAFDLRNDENQNWNDGQLQALSTVDTAIQEAAELIGKLSKTFAEANQSPGTATRKQPSSRKPGENNVYPISPYLEHR